jgi:8-oxo-dGTP pyrophosphatase MutT (NUDIX family)
MGTGRQAYRPERPIVAELAAGAVVVHRESGQVVLLYHRTQDRWALPKGHVDPGESLRQTALREVREETGLADVELDDEIAEVSYRFYNPDRALNIEKVSVYFLGFTSERDLRPEPIFSKAEWVDLPDAIRRVPYETDRHVLSRAGERLRATPSH